MTEADVGSRLREDVAALDWYHTLELEPGLETPGWFDARPIVDQVPLPAALTGRRCLDVGTFDGFWSFEMERRGASEVIAIDVLDPREWDWPVGSDPETVAAIGRRKAGGAGFELARRCLGSAVERRELSVYDLDRSTIGEFDVVYLGSLLIHLRDPVRALERVRSVCRGDLVLVDNVDLVLSMMHPRKPVAMLEGRHRPWWWRANHAGLRQIVESAGFEVIEGPRRLYMPPGRDHPAPPISPRLLLSRQGREALFTSRRGDPHAALLAAPR